MPWILQGERIPSSRAELWAWIARTYPVFANVQSPDEPAEGIRVTLGQKKGDPLFTSRPNPSESRNRPEGSLDLLVVDWTFGTEELSAYSGPIRQVEGNPYLLMHPRNALQVGVSGKNRCIIKFDGGPLEVELRIVNNIAPGVIVMPRHRKLPWQKLKRWPVKVTISKIEKQLS